MVHRHLCVPAGGNGSERPIDEQVRVVVAGGVAMRRELGDLDAAGQVAEETRSSRLPVRCPYQGAALLVACALSSYQNYGTIGHAKNWSSQSCFGVDS